MSLASVFTHKLLAWQKAFKQPRTFERVKGVLVGLLASFGRSTVTNSIMARGGEQQDWSADYKVFSRSDWKLRVLFKTVLEDGSGKVPKEAPIVIVLDDTSLPKTGHKIHGTRWCHDPLAPPFLEKRIQWGLRMLHAALLIPDPANHRPLAVSVAFESIPAEPKPKGELTEAEAADFIVRKREASLTTRTVDLIRHFRSVLDGAGHRDRGLLIVGDGSFTNRAVVKGLPPRTHFLGRFRKDARLYAPLAAREGKRLYGDPLPRPVEFRQDSALPEQRADLHYGGKLRTIRFKEVPGVLWKDGTKGRVMRLLIVLPIPYRVPGKRKRGYNAEAYLLTTDLASPASQLIQAYLDRWQIEVLHRELKSGLGVGQVQSWSKNAVPKIHGAHVAAFSMLLLAAQEVFDGTREGTFPEMPAWRRIPPMRPSVHDLVTRLRNDLVRTGFFGKTRPLSVPKGWVLSHRETYQAA